jgi:tripartite-type tricarboxylate transporter receptor subunit TctC
MKATIRTLCSLFCRLAAASLIAGAASAQTYPNQPIHFIVPLGAGSSTDIFARLVSQGITEETGQPVLVENKPGATGLLGARSVATAKPDGYTVLVTSTTHVINSSLFKNPGYDPLKDFVPVATLVEFPMYLFVNASSPYKNLDDLVKRAKQDPGKVSFATGSATQRLMSEMLKQKASVEMVNVPYKTTAAALSDLVAGGLVDFMFTDAASAKAYWESGRIRPLAVGGGKRGETAPDVPTVDEAGVKGYDWVGSWFGAWVPANTPEPVVKRLHALIGNAMKTKRVQDAMEATGIRPLLMSQEAFARFQVEEFQKTEQVVKAAGIEPQ